jgi:hypothetical protein
MKWKNIKKNIGAPINATIITLGIYINTNVLCYIINFLKFLKVTYYSPKDILHKISFLCSINLRVFGNRQKKRLL